MRVTRVEKFKKSRRKKLRNFIIYVLFLPSLSIFIGYVLTSLIILPAISK